MGAPTLSLSLSLSRTECDIQIQGENPCLTDSDWHEFLLEFVHRMFNTKNTFTGSGCQNSLRSACLSACVALAGGRQAASLALLRSARSSACAAPAEDSLASICRLADRQTQTDTDSQTDRQTDRQTQTGRQTQAGRQTEKQTDRQTVRQLGQTDRQIPEIQSHVRARSQCRKMMSQWSGTLPFCF